MPRDVINMAFKMVYGGVNLPQKYGNFFAFKIKYLNSTAVLLVAFQIRTVQNIQGFKNSWHPYMLHVRTSATVSSGKSRLINACT